MWLGTLQAIIASRYFVLILCVITSYSIHYTKLYEKNISGETREILQLNVDNTYSMFLDIVSKSRNIEIEYSYNFV